MTEEALNHDNFMATGTIVSDKERECIRKARATRLSVAQARRRDIDERGIPFANPFSGITGGEKEEGTVRGKVRQILSLPVMLVTCAFILLMIPFTYAAHLRNVRAEKAKLKDEIKRWSSEPTSFKVSDNKRLAALWAFYGLESYKYSFDVQLDLLKEWLDILYGNGAAETFDLSERVAEIQEQQANADLEDKKNPKAPHPSCGPPIPTLIRRLSDELPPYATF